MIFGIKEKDPYNVFLTIATNITQRLKAGFVVQDHISVHSLKQITIFSQFYVFI